MPREFLEGAVFASLGAKRDEVVVGPGHGLDNAVVSLGSERVLLLTADPVSVIPSIGLKESAFLSVHLLASDLATSGVMPQFAMLDLNLPPEMGLSSVSAYAQALGEECKALGIAIVGGHTGRYPGSGYTVVGGGMMLAIADDDAYITPAMARPGDAVLITKGAAIGAAAVLARSFPERVRKGAGDYLLRRAAARLRDCSTVRDALAASSVGLREGVTSMHDATEGGVLGGLAELASASGLPALVAREKIHVPEDTGAVCEAFGLDPLTTLSEGTLIVTCLPHYLDEVIAALSRERIEGFEVGRLGSRREGRGLWVSSKGSRPAPHIPSPDGYWRAYAAAARVTS